MEIKATVRHIRGEWGQLPKARRDGQPPATHTNQGGQQRQIQQLSVLKMPTCTRTVVVGDMVVAEDSDSELSETASEADGIEDDESVPNTKPKVLRIVSCRSSAGTLSTTAAEPGWHALLRRTPSSRTASIARNVPQCRAGSRPIPTHQAAHLIRTDGHPRPAVNVPAKVLVPRTRLLFPLLSRARTVQATAAVVGSPASPVGSVDSSGAPRPANPARLDAGDAPEARPPRVVVSAAGPLSRAESAVLDGVLDMEEELRYRQRGSLIGDLATLMWHYGVVASDTFPEDLP